MSNKHLYDDYISYLKSKASVNNKKNKNYNYNKSYNRALQFLKDNQIQKAIFILRDLYKIRKDPDVLRQLQLLRLDNPACL